MEAVEIERAAKLIRVPTAAKLTVLHANTYKDDLLLSVSCKDGLLLSVSWLVIAKVLWFISLKTNLSVSES